MEAFASPKHGQVGLSAACRVCGAECCKDAQQLWNAIISCKKTEEFGAVFFQKNHTGICHSSACSPGIFNFAFVVISAFTQQNVCARVHMLKEENRCRAAMLLGIKTFAAPPTPPPPLLVNWLY